MNEGKLIGMKSHDCHVFMETLIPIAFSHLPERMWKPITEISLFLKDLCSGKLLESSLDRMEENILVTTTMLEKIFPCGFFDVMEHLPIHLVQEACLGGSVQTRWMYPFEIFTKLYIFTKSFINIYIHIYMQKNWQFQANN